MMKHISVLSVLAFLAASALPAHADETVGEKVENTASDAKTSAKKSGRKMKKKTRDATGNSSAKEDAKDSLNNAGDDISSGADKLKNKVD